MDSVDCDVVLLPDEKLASKTIAASKKLASLDTFFTLEKNKCHPHVSVYMLRVKIEEIPKVEKTLSEIAIAQPVFNLIATKYHQSHNYFDAEYQKTNQLSKLQEEIVEVLNSLRDGWLEHVKPQVAKSSGLARQNFEKYGWNTVGELWRPHLTLTRFTNEQPDAESFLPPVASFGGRFDKLALVEMGSDQVAKRKIAEFQLGS